MRIMVEMLIGLRYKLQMMGAPLDGPCNVFCDNEAVMSSSMNAETTLKKKHLSIAYHKTRETVAAGIILVFYEKSGSNHADLFTKVLPAITRNKLMSYICGKVPPTSSVHQFQFSTVTGERGVLNGSVGVTMTNT